MDLETLFAHIIVWLLLFFALFAGFLACYDYYLSIKERRKKNV